MFKFDMTVLLSAVATMFLLLAAGFIARKAGIIDDKLSKGLSNLIICVGQPFMIVDAVVSMKYTPENFKTGMFILLLGTIIHAVTAAIALGSTFFIKNIDERSITEFGLLFSNCGFMGFPILRSMFGDIGVFWGSFYIIVFNIVTWTYGMYILHRARPEIKMNFVKMIFNYGTTPCIIGLLLFIARINLPDFVSGAVSYLGSLCTPISMLVIGGLLATIPVKKLFASPKVYYSCA
ncbi:MAG: AEC family transporter, partial [Eubacteriales bacterium]